MYGVSCSFIPVFNNKSIVVRVYVGVFVCVWERCLFVVWICFVRVGTLPTLVALEQRRKKGGEERVGAYGGRSICRKKVWLWYPRLCSVGLDPE